MQILLLGSRGLDVMRVQQALNRCMLVPNNRFTSPPMKRLVEDGAFGPKTEAMVREFQRLNQIKIDGIVGPITSYLIFPYIYFTARLAGKGKIIGRREYLGLEQRSGFSAKSALFASPVGSSTLTAPLEKNDAEEKKEGFTFEVSSGPGIKHTLKPWFVLKPKEEPEGAKSEATLTVEATILRKKGFEFGGELEFGRQLFAKGGSSWEWEGTIKGAYTDLKFDRGIFSGKLSPIAELTVKQGLKFSPSLGGEVEASVELIKDRLELSVGGKVTGEWDTHEGNVQIGGEISGALKFKWDVVRFLKK